MEERNISVRIIFYLMCSIKFLNLNFCNFNRNPRDDAIISINSHSIFYNFKTIHVSLFSEILKLRETRSDRTYIYIYIYTIYIYIFASFHRALCQPVPALISALVLSCALKHSSDERESNLVTRGSCSLVCTIIFPVAHYVNSFLSVVRANSIFPFRAFFPPCRSLRPLCFFASLLWRVHARVFHASSRRPESSRILR